MPRLDASPEPTSPRPAVSAWAIAGFAVACLVLLLGTHALGAPRLDASGIRLRSLGIPIATISYADVESVRAQSFAGMVVGGNPFRTLRVAASCLNGVSIQRRSGWFNRILVCPADPRAFVQEVEARRRSRPTDPDGD